MLRVPQDDGVHHRKYKIRICHNTKWMKNVMVRTQQTTIVLLLEPYLHQFSCKHAILKLIRIEEQ